MSYKFYYLLHVEYHFTTRPLTIIQMLYFIYSMIYFIFYIFLVVILACTLRHFIHFKVLEIWHPGNDAGESLWCCSTIVKTLTNS